MKTAVLLLLLLRGAAPVIHSYKNFYTVSSGVPNFPQYVAFSLVDEVEILRYDSNTRRAEPRQHWMDKAIAEDPQYLETQTQFFFGDQQIAVVGTEELKHRFNHTDGGHMVQRMSGCEWDDQSGEINDFEQFAYDGEDFLSLDMKTLTWIAAKQQAVPTKLQWDQNKDWLEHRKQTLSKQCIDWLKVHLAYGESSLLRTVRPSVSLLQRTTSSMVSCFATGFFPDRALIFWKKDGEELHEGVDIGELLPNHDGTFQISADLTLPENATDLHKYECVFRLTGLKEDLVYRLEARSMKTNHGNPGNPYTIIFILVAAFLALAVFLGRIFYRRTWTALRWNGGRGIFECGQTVNTPANMD